MALIDYLKQDNIDTNSKGENFPPKTTTPKAKTVAVLVAELSAEAASTEIASMSGAVQAVIVRCNSEKRNFVPWSATTVLIDHPVFLEPVPPVLGLIKVLLVLHQLRTQSSNQADLDNQITTYININTTSRFAPPEWQLYVSTVVAVCKDRKLLLLQYLKGMQMYCDYILDLFREGEGVLRQLYNQVAFKKQQEQYCKEQKDQPGKRGKQDPDDQWVVCLLYEV